MTNIIAKSSKPFPDWMKTHPVFDNIKIDKVFPKIGLPNFTDQVEVVLGQDALNAAKNLGMKVQTELANLTAYSKSKLDGQIFRLSKERDNDLCAKLRPLVVLLDGVNNSLSHNDYYKIIDKKVVLKLREDIKLTDGTVVFKKDEAVLKVFGKLVERVKGLNCPNAVIPTLDQTNEFKEFSRLNVPCKIYTLVFSSSGEEGAWDISTISMRGITSCQSWNAPQSRGLIGTIASKYTGTIFIESDQDMPPYGKKMTFRCVVRLAIKEGSAVLVLDNMYPSVNADMLAAFKKILSEKSGLNVFHSSEGPRNANILDEPSRKFLKNGEFAYMDYQIPVVAAKSLIKKPISIDLEPIKQSLIDELQNKVSTTRTAYIEKALNAKLDKELSDFGKGGVMNLLNHFDKKYGNNSAGKIFAQYIFQGVNTLQFLSKKEFYHFIIKQRNTLRSNGWKNSATGTWSKSFPKSSERLYNYIFDCLLTIVKKQIKELSNAQ